MNKSLIALSAVVMSLTAAAQSNTALYHISQVSVNKGEKMLTLNMSVSPQEFKLKGNDILTLTPVVVAKGDSIEMPSVKIAGKQAWYAEIRDRRETPLTLSRAGKGSAVEYSATVPYSSKFENSTILIKADTVSICNCDPARGGFKPFIKMDFRSPQPTFSFNYIAPKDSAEKIFNLSGRANVVFKVNRTDIDWGYAGNHAELDTILRTINVVRNNPDATVEAIYLTGYASPEGPYDNNVRLAKGRTEAVMDYVAKHSQFPRSIYHTGFVAEDWAGLREWIVNSNIENRDAMIAFIDDKSISEASRNDIFMKRFPGQYPFLLANVYPSLRHTDYRIRYKVRKYYELEEMRQALINNPRNLSLNELFLLANSCEPGSVEYDEIFELAASLYPDNRVANLNAANSAMNRGLYAQAERYLSRAGNGAEVEYARGILQARQGNLDAAKALFEKALQGGVSDAQNALDEIKRVKSYKQGITIL